jgi:hypothetical protein
VRGASVHRGREGPPDDWTPLTRPARLDPLARFAGWSPALHDRFDWLAGRELRALGYPPSPILDRPWRALRHRTLDRVRRPQEGRRARRRPSGDRPASRRRRSGA